MKKANKFNIAFVFSGSFLGAGYVSGQELYQFFASYGISGFWGIPVSLTLFFAFGVILMLLCRETKLVRPDELIVFGDFPFLKKLNAFIQAFFLFGIYVIMCAGASALLNQLFGVPVFLGSGIFCTVIFLLSKRGMNGVMRVFSFFVPPLVLGAVAIALICAFKYGFSFDGITVQKSSFSHNWLISAVVYVSYNLTTSIGVFSPVGVNTKDKKSIFSGIFMGCLILGAVSVFVLLSIFSVPESVNYQLPVLYIAAKIAYPLGIVYAFLLLGAMLGTSLSSVVALCEYIKNTFPNIKRKENTLLLVFSILSWFLSLLGFADLIGTVYPICGYVGFFALASIIIHYIKVRKAR